MENLLLGTMIVKNGADTIVNTIDSWMSVCSSFYVLDTGSTDNTIFILKKLKEKYKERFDYFQTIFRGFSNSRNDCLDLSFDSKYAFTIQIDDSYKLCTQGFGENLLHELKAIKNIPQINCIAVRIHTNNQNYFQKRIIRSDSKIRYEGIINEDLSANTDYIIESFYIEDVSCINQRKRTLEKLTNDLNIIERVLKRIINNNIRAEYLYLKASTLHKLYFANLVHLKEVIDCYKRRVLINCNDLEQRFLSCIMIAHLSTKKVDKMEYYSKALIFYPNRSGEVYLYLYLMTNEEKYIKYAYYNRNVKQCALPINNDIYANTCQACMIDFYRHKHVFNKYILTEYVKVYKEFHKKCIWQN